MSIDQAFEKYPNNILGFRINKTFKIIDVWLNNNWEINDKDSDFVIQKQKENEDKTKSYFIIYSEIANFEALFNKVSEIIEYNLDLERKQLLFAEKIQQMKALFNEMSYDELKNLNFDDIIKSKEE